MTITSLPVSNQECRGGKCTIYVPFNIQNGIYSTFMMVYSVVYWALYESSGHKLTSPFLQSVVCVVSSLTPCSLLSRQQACGLNGVEVLQHARTLIGMGIHQFFGTFSKKPWLEMANSKQCLTVHPSVRHIPN